LPEEMKPWAEKNFGSSASVESQKIIKVFNKLSFEESLFNELRAKRPLETRTDEDSIKMINESIGDPFCKPLTGTPADTFGRIKGKYCVTASNVAKYDGLHGLIIFKEHNPLNFSEKQLQDYISTAIKWFSKANKSNKEAIYPYLLWNCLWRSGASIIHGHMQMVLGEGIPYADAEYYNEIMRIYQEKYKADYFQELCKAHELIGLGMNKKGLLLFTNLTQRKDKEITLISKKLDKKCVSAIYKIANCLVKEFGVNSFNLGILFPPINPPINKDDSWKDFPVIIRIVDRGKLSNKTTDFGGMEMYAHSSVIETDPYVVFEKVKKYF
jgi:hypothetical protein